MISLNPCPKCGCTFIHLRGKKDRIDDPQAVVYAECPECHTRGTECVADTTERAMEMAVDYWNQKGGSDE